MLLWPLLPLLALLARPKPGPLLLPLLFQDRDRTIAASTADPTDRVEELAGWGRVLRVGLPAKPLWLSARAASDAAAAGEGGAAACGTVVEVACRSTLRRARTALLD